MSYTVKKLAKLSGVSVRALHWYDEVGLLKPAYYGTNGYRYYEEEQLLELQQILFFRELDFPLDEIRRIISGNDFDKVKALTAHKKTLRKSLERTKELIKTIDKTLLHIRGIKKMEDQEFYYGFESEKQKAYEKELKKILKEKNVENVEDYFEQSKKRTQNWKKEDWENLKREGDSIHRELTQALKEGLSPSEKEVQIIIEKHFKMIKRFYTPTKEVYRGLGDLYCDHPDFRKLYDSYHSDLASFLAEAMNVFAEKKLS